MSAHKCYKRHLLKEKKRKRLLYEGSNLYGILLNIVIILSQFCAKCAVKLSFAEGMALVFCSKQWTDAVAHVYI